MTILLEALLEARVKEISNSFFRYTQNSINKKDTVKEKLKKLDSIKKQINKYTDKEKELETEFENTKKEVQKEAAKIVIESIFDFLSIDIPSNVSYSFIEGMTDLIKINSSDNTLKSYIKIAVPGPGDKDEEDPDPAKKRGHKIKIVPEGSIVVYKKEDKDLYLWTTDSEKKYQIGVKSRGDIPKGSQFGKYATGAQKSKVGKADIDSTVPAMYSRKGVKSLYKAGSRTLSRNKGIENTRKAIDSEFAWDEVINKFAKEEKGVAPGNMNIINNKIEDLLLDIINVCLEEEMINLDQSELDTEVKLVGDPSGDNQEVIAYLGPEGTPIIKISTFINNKTYKVDKYKTKIQVNGLDMT